MYKNEYRMLHFNFDLNKTILSKKDHLKSFISIDLNQASHEYVYIYIHKNFVFNGLTEPLSSWLVKINKRKINGKLKLYYKN